MKWNKDENGMKYCFSVIFSFQLLKILQWMQIAKWSGREAQYAKSETHFEQNRNRRNKGPGEPGR